MKVLFAVVVMVVVSAAPTCIYAEEKTERGETKDQILSNSHVDKQPCGCKSYYLADRCADGYFVIYPEVVPRLYAIKYYKSCKGKQSLPSLSEYCSHGAAVEDIKTFDKNSKNLPKSKFAKPLVLFSDLDPALVFQRKLPSSDIINNDDGYYSANFVVRVQQSVSYNDVNYLDRLKKLAPESEGVDFQDDSALVVFGACLTKKSALKFTDEIKKTGVRASIVRLRVNEPDM